jgi:thioredoxin 1
VALAPRSAALAALAVLALSCSSSAQEPRAAAPAASPAHAAGGPQVGSRPRLVFFMNPNGGPCQLQDRILRDLSAELGARVDVVSYKTTEPADIGLFQLYGIRSLPQLLVTDATGRELRRATPGIQGADQVRGLVAF